MSTPLPDGIRYVRPAVLAILAVAVVLFIIYNVQASRVISRAQHLNARGKGNVAAIAHVAVVAQYPYSPAATVSRVILAGHYDTRRYLDDPVIRRGPSALDTLVTAFGGFTPYKRDFFALLMLELTLLSCAWYADPLQVRGRKIPRRRLMGLAVVAMSSLVALVFFDLTYPPTAAADSSAGSPAGGPFGLDAEAASFVQAGAAGWAALVFAWAALSAWSGDPIPQHRGTVETPSSASRTVVALESGQQPPEAAATAPHAPAPAMPPLAATIGRGAVRALMTVSIPGVGAQTVGLTAGSHRFGRSPDNDYVLNLDSVSRYHALVTVQPDGAVALTNLARPDSVRVDGVPMQSNAPRSVTEHQRLRLPGDTIVTFSGVSTGAPPTSEAPGPPPATDMTIGTGPVHSVMTVEVPGYGRQTVALGAPVVRIGRAPDNDYVLTLPQVSGYQATLSRSGAGFSVVNLSSGNPVQVDGRPLRVHEIVALQPSSVIRLPGEVCLRFVLR